MHLSIAWSLGVCWKKNRHQLFYNFILPICICQSLGRLEFAGKKIDINFFTILFYQYASVNRLVAWSLLGKKIDINFFTILVITLFCQYASVNHLVAWSFQFVSTRFVVLAATARYLMR
jgi:hypothetical protein